jgi:hypothetical protein
MITEKSKKEIVAMALSVNLGLPLAFIVGIQTGLVYFIIQGYIETGKFTDALLAFILFEIITIPFGIWYFILLSKNKKRLAPIDANPSIPIRFESDSGVKGTLHIGEQRITIWGQVNKKKYAEASALLAQISEHSNNNPLQTPFS